MSRRRPLSYERKKSCYGYVFISLWMIGFVFFFFIPFISAVVYSFHNMEVQPGNVVLTSPGWQNYRRMFVEDSERRVFAGFYLDARVGGRPCAAYLRVFSVHRDHP